MMGRCVRRRRAMSSGRGRTSDQLMIDIRPAADRTAQLVTSVADEQLDLPTPCPGTRLGDLIDHVGSLSTGLPRVGPQADRETATGHHRSRARRTSVRGGATRSRETCTPWPTRGRSPKPGRGSPRPEGSTCRRRSPDSSCSTSWSCTAGTSPWPADSATSRPVPEVDAAMSFVGVRLDGSPRSGGPCEPAARSLTATAAAAADRRPAHARGLAAAQSSGPHDPLRGRSDGRLPRSDGTAGASSGRRGLLHEGGVWPSTEAALSAVVTGPMSSGFPRRLSVVKATNLADLYQLPLLDWGPIEARLEQGVSQAPETGGPEP